MRVLPFVDVDEDESETASEAQTFYVRRGTNLSVSEFCGAFDLRVLYGTVGRCRGTVLPHTEQPHRVTWVFSPTGWDMGTLLAGQDWHSDEDRDRV